MPNHNLSEKMRTAAEWLDTYEAGPEDWMNAEDIRFIANWLRDRAAIQDEELQIRRMATKKGVKASLVRRVVREKMGVRPVQR